MVGLGKKILTEMIRFHQEGEERMKYMYKTGEQPGKGEYTCTNCGQVVVLDDNTDTLPLNVVETLIVSKTNKWGVMHSIIPPLQQR